VHACICCRIVLKVTISESHMHIDSVIN